MVRPPHRRLPVAFVLKALALQGLATLAIYLYWTSFSSTPTGPGLHALPSVGQQDAKRIPPRSSSSTSTSTSTSNRSRLHHNHSTTSSTIGQVAVVNSRYRTLWTAGWNARYAMYFRDPAPVVRWDAGAEAILETEWRRLQFPPSCDSVRGWYVIEPLSWGLASVARDYVSSLLRAMARNYTLVYRSGFRFCPQEAAGKYIDCFWQDLGSCQSWWEERGKGTTPAVEEPWPEAVKRVGAEDFPHWLWDAMRRSGAVHVGDGVTGRPIRPEGESRLDPALFLQAKMSVLRAMIARVVLQPRPHVLASADKLVQEWRALGASSDPGGARGLVIHLRRTDKAKDDGPHWRHIDFTSTAHIGPLIHRIEQAIHRSFPHFLVLSDDTRLHKQATRDLAADFASPSVLALSTELLCHFLGDDHLTFDKGGHEAMDDASRAKLYEILLVELYAAIAVSDYVIGSGSCGVSQFLAQNLGGRHRVEPGLIALWEDDIVVEECRTWMDDVVTYHSRCDEWRRNETLRIAAKARADKSLKRWRETECSVFVPLPEMVVCLL